MKFKLNEKISGRFPVIDDDFSAFTCGSLAINALMMNCNYDMDEVFDKFKDYVLKLRLVLSSLLREIEQNSHEIKPPYKYINYLDDSELESIYKVMSASKPSEFAEFYNLIYFSNNEHYLFEILSRCLPTLVHLIKEEYNIFTDERTKITSKKDIIKKSTKQFDELDENL